MEFSAALILIPPLGICRKIQSISWVSFPGITLNEERSHSEDFW